MRICLLCLTAFVFAACSTSPRVRYTSSMFAPVPAATEEGVASWYHANWFGIGEMTASGERFRQYDMTAAHKHLPLGSFVRVTNLRNGRSTIARIQDRGPGDRHPHRRDCAGPPGGAGSDVPAAEVALESRTITG